jgi:hypothetical protein
MPQIFFSHATADKPLLDALIKLIEGGIGIASGEIFCTTFEEQGIPSGADFAPYMRKQLAEDASVVIALVSPQYYGSLFCMCETGGAWATNKKLIPLLTPPITYHDMRGALYGKQALLINEPSKLDQLRDELKHLAAGESTVTRWNRRKEEFLKGLPALLAALKPVDSLSASEAAGLKKELANYKDENVKLDAENERLQAIITDLKKERPRKVVAAILQKHSEEEDVYKELAKIATKESHKLPRVVRRALYDHFCRNPFVPDYNEWQDEPADALERRLLREDNDGHFEPNADHPKIKPALKALRALRDFIDECSEEFRSIYEAQKSELLDFGSLTFWEDNDLL